MREKPTTSLALNYESTKSFINDFAPLVSVNDRFGKKKQSLIVLLTHFELKTLYCKGVDPTNRGVILSPL